MKKWLQYLIFFNLVFTLVLSLTLSLTFSLFFCHLQVFHHCLSSLPLSHRPPSSCSLLLPLTSTPACSPFRPCIHASSYPVCPDCHPSPYLDQHISPFVHLSFFAPIPSTSHAVFSIYPTRISSPPKPACHTRFLTPPSLSHSSRTSQWPTSV